MTASTGEHWDMCLQALRDLDRDRYLACLLSPADKRGPLSALYAFNAEIARVRDVVQQPLAGEIRLQWWRDTLEGSGSGDASANPVAAALLETIETYRLPRQILINMIEARLFDLYDDPMPDRNSFEGYAGETASALIQLAGLILDPQSAVRVNDASGHAGVAQAVAGCLLLLPVHVRRGQVYIPLDLLSAVGLNRESFLAADNRVAVGHAIAAFAGLGLDHLAQARKAGALPTSLIPAFLAPSLAEPVLKRASRMQAAVLDTPLYPPQWRRQWRMLSTLIRRKI